jgi:hypothetical protein
VGGLADEAVAAERARFYREVNLTALYSRRDQRLDFHPMPLFSSIGFECLRKFSGQVPGRLNPDALDLYLQFAYDPAVDRVKILHQDAWVRFLEPASGIRVRLGRFELPFGLNPAMEPRGEALQPLAAFDLGFKKDWGVAVQGQWRRFAYETAATLGTGHSFRHRRGRYLWSGRVGVPTYRDSQYGVSFLYGVAVPPGAARSRPTSWRLSMDAVLMHHEPFTVLMAELSSGADSGVPVGGFLLALTHILPAHPHWGFEGQMRRWRKGASPEDRTRAESAVGLWRSLPGLLTLRLHWRHHFSSAGVREDDQVFAQLYYYGY